MLDPYTIVTSLTLYELFLNIRVQNHYLGLGKPLLGENRPEKPFLKAYCMNENYRIP